MKSNLGVFNEKWRFSDSNKSYNWHLSLIRHERIVLSEGTRVTNCPSVESDHVENQQLTTKVPSRQRVTDKWRSSWGRKSYLTIKNSWQQRHVRKKLQKKKNYS